MSELFYVIKRDGRKEEFKFSKIEKAINYCSQGLNIDLEKFTKKFMLTIYPGIKTTEIQQNLINTVLQIITEDENKEEWSYFANRLILLHYRSELARRRKNEYPEFTISKHFAYFKKPSEFKEYLKLQISRGIYNELLLKIPYHIFVRIYKQIFPSAEKEFIDRDKLWRKGVFHYQTEKLIKTYVIDASLWAQWLRGGKRCTHFTRDQHGDLGR